MNLRPTRNPQGQRRGWLSMVGFSLLLLIPMVGFGQEQDETGRPETKKPKTQSTKKFPVKPATKRQSVTPKSAEAKPKAAVSKPGAGKLPAAKAVSRVASDEERIWSSDLKSLAAHYRMSSDSIGYMLYDLDQKKVLESWQEKNSFIPASVTKVPTAVAALAILGPEHRFDISVYAIGEQVGNLLKGDLYLKGGGDPGMMATHLQKLVRELKSTGITQIAGRFHFDNSWSVEIEQIDPTQPKDVGYNPGIGALSIDFNRMLVAWTTTPKLGTVASTLPSLPGITIDAKGPPLASNGQFAHTSHNGEETWRATRPLTGSGQIHLPVKLAGLYTARMFAKFCKNHGIALPDPVPQPAITPANARLLARHLGESLLDLTRDTLKHSNNMMAEMIGLAAARHEAGKAQSFPEASEQIKHWWISQLGGVEMASYLLPNFSGLSSAARMTPTQLVEILRYANGKENTQEAFFARLPIPHWKKSLMGAGGQGMVPQVWVKTGTMYYGRALTGLIVSRNKHRLVFAVFNTDMEKRQAFDSKLFGQDDEEGNTTTTVSHPSDHEAKAWLSRARELERALVTRWVMSY